jgi:CBS domain-containing protein
MSALVRDVMNPQLLYVSEGDSLLELRAKILRFGVTAVPVLDGTLRPSGVVALRDFSDDGTTVRMSAPAVTVLVTDTVERAAKQLLDADVRQLVVVDERGITIGMVSATDLLRSVLGAPPRHPPRFDVECTSADAFGDPR